MSHNFKRKLQFRRWWAKRHHNHNAHLWLCNHARRTARDLFLAPVAADTVHHITRRYFKSQYKLLTRESAWTLWKLIHPVRSVRTAHMLDAAAELRTAKDQLK